MEVTVLGDAPAREDDSRAAALPSASCTERYVFPTPNIETLKNILRWHGGFEPFIEAVAEGYAPREFQIGMTGVWKVRDVFYLLAAASAECFVKKELPRLNIGSFLNMIVETTEPHNAFLHELCVAADSVGWEQCACSTGSFWWPTHIPACFMLRDLLTAIRLCVLHTIWSTNPEALLGVDFSAGLADFSNERCALIQKLIYDAIQSRQALSESVEAPHAEHIALTADVQRILNVLRDGAKSRQELQELLGVGRTVLLKRFLAPVRESGLVVTTEQGSSPNQRYRLVSEDETVGEKQAPSESETGLAYPVSTDLVPPQKQADLPKNGVVSPVAVSVFTGGYAPVRLARYNRWSEAERALILLGRVERFLRNSFESGTWKELGIVEKLTATDLIAFENCLFDPKYWGPNAGVVLRQEFVDYNNKHCTLTVGESNLLNLFAQKTGFDLAVCSETERAEMGRLGMIIPPAVLHLMNYYAQHFGISRNLDKPYHEGDKVMLHAAVEPFILYHSGMTKIVFHGKDRAPQFQVARLDVAGRTLLLPITFYSSAKNPQLCCMFPEVPDRPALYNADAIAAHPGATVILTDEPGIPLVNDNDSDYIYSSVYGGMEMIDKLDRDLLEGYLLNWLCFDNGDGPVKMYEKAVKVARTVFQQHGRKIDSQVFDGVTWTRNVFGMETGTYERSRTLSFDELMAEASKFGVGGCGSNEVADLRALSMDDLVKLKPKDFTLYPLLKEGFYCLIFGGSGVAKTWFALHLAICLSQGRAPFDGWEFRGSAPLNVMYIAGEMDEEEYGDRLRKLLAEQKSNPRFRFLRYIEVDGLPRKNVDLASDEDQERISKLIEMRGSQVVVLDNLSTLATAGHTEGQFEKILSFIRKLQADGIIVLLVHHENRKGDFKGSNMIELVADQSLHLFSAGNGDKIELLIRSEKIRMTSRSEQTAFHTEFDPKNPTDVWPTRELKPKECDRLDIDDPLGEVEKNIGKTRKKNCLAWGYQDEEGRAIAIIGDMLSGYHDGEIAANYSVRENVITEFKQQFGITEDALKQHLPMARVLAENNQGKKDPNALSSELWKLLKSKG